MLNNRSLAGYKHHYEQKYIRMNNNVELAIILKTYIIGKDEQYNYKAEISCGLNCSFNPLTIGLNKQSLRFHINNFKC